MSELSQQPTRHSRKFFVLGGILLVLIIAGLIALPTIQKRWSAPLGPALELPTYTPTYPQPETPTVPVTASKVAQAGEQVNPVTASATPLMPVASTLAPTASPAPTQAPLCGGPPVMMVLAVGVDTEDDTYTYGLGDAIRIVRVDFVTPKITALSLSRDLWVEIPEISDHYNLTHGKLNQSYLYGTPGMGYYDSPGGGPGLMARTLDLNFGLRVDHYGAVNMSTFARIVDAVGGIDVYLPTDVDGTPTNNETEDMGYFYAGQNHFNGDEALRFSRIRKRYNDLTRMDHQNMVICALRKKILSPQVLPKIPQIIAAFKDSVITDLSLEQMSQLACLLPHIDRENLLFTGLPDEVYTPGTIYSPQMRNDTFIMNADPKVIRDYVQRFLAGEWPNEPKEPTCP
jgi:LCP family protein required for cell wall assembly